MQNNKCDPCAFLVMKTRRLCENCGSCEMKKKKIYLNQKDSVITIENEKILTYSFK